MKSTIIPYFNLNYNRVISNYLNYIYIYINIKDVMLYYTKNNILQIILIGTVIPYFLFYFIFFFERLYSINKININMKKIKNKLYKINICFYSFFINKNLLILCVNMKKWLHFFFIVFIK